MKEKIAGFILVLVQFGCLIALIFTGPGIARKTVPLVIELASILFMTLAIWSMKTSRLNAFPQVLHGATLVSAGPYRFIRHPMYSGVLIFALSLILDTFTYTRLLIGTLLLIDLLIKIEIEEKILIREFPTYKEYRKSTRKLLPFIY